MATKVDEGYIELYMKDARYKKGMKEARKQMKTFGDSIKDVSNEFRDLFNMGGSFLAADVLKGWAQEIVNLYSIQVKAETKLAAVVKVTGRAAGFTAKEMLKYAKSLQGVTTYSDAAITNVEAILATFKSIKGDVFLEATEAVLDLATVLDTDARSAAIQLGKALEDPTKGMAAMAESGVTFSASLQEQIKLLQKMGNMPAAQKLILKGVTGQVGGAARAQAGTTVGQIEQARNILDDFGELAGRAYLGVLDQKYDFERILSGLKTTLQIADKVSEITNQLRTRGVVGTIKAQTRKAPATPGGPLPSVPMLDDVRLDVRGMIGTGPMSAAARRDVINNMQNPGGVLFNPKPLQSSAMTPGSVLWRVLETFNQAGKAMPTPDEAKRAVALRRKVNALEETDPQTARFFGLSGFGKSLQESLGKPDEQKKRDEERNVLLREERDLTRGVLERLQSGVAGLFTDGVPR